MEASFDELRRERWERMTAESKLRVALNSVVNTSIVLMLLAVFSILMAAAALGDPSLSRAPSAAIAAVSAVSIVLAWWEAWVASGKLEAIEAERDRWKP